MNKPLPCVLAWAGISTDVNGSIRPCCRYAQPEKQQTYKMPWMQKGYIDDLFNSPQLVELRKALMRGEQVAECQSCWDEEKSNNISYRQEMNTWLIDNLGSEVDFNTSISPAPVYLDLKLTNVCNLMCRMCSPVASSMIQKEKEKLDPSFKGDPYWKENKLVGTYNEESVISWLPYIKVITITGGDPFVGKENREVLQLIYDQGYADKIEELHFNTNGMLMPDGYLNLLKRFKKVDIAFSIDDIGDRLAYQRHGSKFETFVTNWSKVPSTIQKHIYITVNNYNVWYVLEAVEYFKTLTNFISYDFVHHPRHLNISCLSPIVKKKVIEKYSATNDPFWNKLLNFIQLEKPDMTDKFIEETHITDKQRDEDFYKTFPEWAEILNGR